MDTKTVALLFVVLFFSCNFVEEARCKKKWNQKGKKLVGKNGNVVKELNNFAFRFHETLPRNTSEFYSPFGIATSLAMAFAGSGGKTQDEIAMALGWNGKHPKEIHATLGYLLVRLTLGRGKKTAFQTANSIWVEKQETLRNRFKKLIEKYYRGKVGKVNFFGDPEGTRTRINEWAKLKTKGAIKDLLPKGSITKETRVILSNAVYFKALWDIPFPREETKLRKFRTVSNNFKWMQMMKGTFEIPILKDDLFSGIELPYKRKRFAMVVLLPTGSHSLEDVERNLNFDRLEKAYDGTSPVQVILPRFKLTARYKLVNKLRKLGIKSLFSNQCDLSGVLTFGDGVYITDAIHKAYVSVNEDGTEAAAATALFLGRSLLPTFIADRPFLFFIKDTADKVILFSGRFSPS